MNELQRYIYDYYSVEQMVALSLKKIERIYNSHDWPTNYQWQGQLRDRMRVNIIEAIRTSLIETGLKIHQLTDVVE